jgi:hypothetical protein
MEINPGIVPQQKPQSNQQNNAKDKLDQVQFGSLLSDKVNTVSAQAILAAEETEKQRLRKEKARLEAIRKPVDEEEETLEQTVKSIKDKIQALAELERRARGLDL